MNYAMGNWSVHVGLQAFARDLAVEKAVLKLFESEESRLVVVRRQEWDFFGRSKGEQTRMADPLLPFLMSRQLENLVISPMTDDYILHKYVNVVKSTF